MTHGHVKPTTGYEIIKKHRAMRLEQSQKELEALADLHGGSSHYLSQEAFKMGLKYAIRNIEETELLFIKAHKELPYSDPEGATREHNNLMNVLGNLKNTLIRRYEEKP